MCHHHHQHLLLLFFLGFLWKLIYNQKQHFNQSLLLILQLITNDEILLEREQPFWKKRRKRMQMIRN